MLLGALILAAALGPPEDWSYPDGDPFYSAEVDRLHTCATRAAKSYRYDYDRPEVSAAEQAASAVRAACVAELAIVEPLIAEQERARGPGRLLGVVFDWFLLDVFFDPTSWPQSEDRELSKPGDHYVDRSGHVTVFAYPSPVAADELVRVTREDADDTNHIPEGPSYLYSGTIEGHPYWYYDSYWSWYGGVRDGEVTASVKCLEPGEVQYWDNKAKLCQIELGDRLLSINTGSDPFAIVEICNPGDVYVGDVIFRPPPPRDGKFDLARAGRLVVDGGETLALPTSARCLNIKTGNLPQRLLDARHLKTSFISRFGAMPIAREGSPYLLRSAMMLASHLHRLISDPAAIAKMKADRTQLANRAHPLTPAEHLTFQPEWKETLRCLVRSAESGNEAHRAAVLAAMQVSPCRNWLADLEWQAAHADAGYTIPNDKPETVKGTSVRMDAARQLIEQAAVSALETSAPVNAAGEFATGEAETSVRGAAGRSGLTRHEGGVPQAFGYALANGKAIAVLPSVFGWSRGQEPTHALPSIEISCEPGADLPCTIQVPMNDNDGAFSIRTRGSWHGSELCVRRPEPIGNTWRIAWKSYGLEDADQLDARGCVQLSAVSIYVADVSSIFLVSPDDKEDVKESDDRMADPFGALKVAMALAGYLASRLEDEAR